jgi:AcrR family transcriptional regulator
MDYLSVVPRTQTLRPPAERAASRGPSELQRSKSEQTRARVLDAAVGLIAEGGPRSATSQRLARASGVSWGAIQYQFGSKAGVLEALLDRTLAAFAEGVPAAAGGQGSALADRVHALVEAVAALLREPVYRAFRRLLQDPELLDELRLAPADLLGRIHAAVHPGIRAALAEPGLSDDDLDLVQALLFATLSGVIEQSRYDGFPDRMTREQLRLLEAQLVDVVTVRATP